MGRQTLKLMTNNHFDVRQPDEAKPETRTRSGGLQLTRNNSLALQFVLTQCKPAANYSTPLSPAVPPPPLSPPPHSLQYRRRVCRGPSDRRLSGPLTPIVVPSPPTTDDYRTMNSPATIAQGASPPRPIRVRYQRGGAIRWRWRRWRRRWWRHWCWQGEMNSRLGFDMRKNRVIRRRKR